MSPKRMAGLGNSPLGQPEVIFRLEVGGNVTEIYYGFRRQELIYFSDNTTRNNGTYLDEEPYDYGGAMYFAVAVILIYGISIAFLIGTTLRKSQQDDEVKGFLRSYANLDDRVYAKQRVRKALKEKNLLTLVTETTRVAAAAGAGMVMGINPQPIYVRPEPREPLQELEGGNVGPWRGDGLGESQDAGARGMFQSIEEESPVHGELFRCKLGQKATRQSPDEMEAMAEVRKYQSIHEESLVNGEKFQGKISEKQGKKGTYQGQGQGRGVADDRVIFQSIDQEQSRHMELFGGMDKGKSVYAEMRGYAKTEQGQSNAYRHGEGFPVILHMNGQSKKWRYRDASANRSRVHCVKGKYPGTVVKISEARTAHLEGNTDCPITKTKESNTAERFKYDITIDTPDQNPTALRNFHLEKFLISQNDSNTSIADSGVCSATLAEEGSLGDDLNPEKTLEPKWGAWNPASVVQQSHTLDIQARDALDIECESLDGIPATATLDFQAPFGTYNALDTYSLDKAPTTLDFQAPLKRHSTLDSQSLDVTNATLDGTLPRNASSVHNFPTVDEAHAFPSRDNSCIFVSLEDESEYLENKVSMEELTLMEKNSMTMNL